MKGSRSSSSSGVISGPGAAMKSEHKQSSKWGQTAEVLRWSQAAQRTKARRGKDLHGIRNGVGQRTQYWTRSSHGLLARGENSRCWPKRIPPIYAHDQNNIPISHTRAW
ncbi:hypothetical protein NL676_004398 [Syzygium grande]|nr:hypothetical protein NL676_004398 [Syzygium grande]